MSANGLDGRRAGGALELVQKRWYDWDYDLREGERTLAEVRVAHWRDRGEANVDGVSYRVRPLDWLGRQFILTPDDHPVARAERRGLRFGYLVEHQGRHWVVRSQGPFRRGVTIFAGASADRAVGEIRPIGWFHRRAAVLLPPDMPLVARAFVGWLAVLHWKRRAARS